MTVQYVYFIRAIGEHYFQMAPHSNGCPNLNDMHTIASKIVADRHSKILPGEQYGYMHRYVTLLTIQHAT